MTAEGRHWCRSGVFIINLEQILDVILVFSLLLLTTSKSRLGGLLSHSANTWLLRSTARDARWFQLKSFSTNNNKDYKWCVNIALNWDKIATHLKNDDRYQNPDFACKNLSVARFRKQYLKWKCLSV